MTADEARGLADYLHHAVIKWVGKTGELSRNESPRWDRADDTLLASLSVVETSLRAEESPGE
jgi:hypothetical protein